MGGKDVTCKGVQGNIRDKKNRAGGRWEIKEMNRPISLKKDFPRKEVLENSLLFWELSIEKCTTSLKSIRRLVKS